MGRPREFNDDDVLNALRDVFWEHGYEGTSYADIMAATDLKKGSLYAAFGDKRSLYLEAIKQYDKGSVSDGVALLRNEELTGAERIAALMQSLVDAAETIKPTLYGRLILGVALSSNPAPAKKTSKPLKIRF